jgi:hypothetical protein
LSRRSLARLGSCRQRSQRLTPPCSPDRRRPLSRSHSRRGGRPCCSLSRAEGSKAKQLYPSIGASSVTAVLSPALTHAGEVALVDHREQGRDSQATELYPSLLPSSAAVLSPAFTHAGKVGFVSHQESRNASATQLYPSLLPSTAVVLSPALTNTSEVALVDCSRRGQDAQAKDLYLSFSPDVAVLSPAIGHNGEVALVKSNQKPRAGQVAARLELFQGSSEDAKEQQERVSRPDLTAFARRNDIRLSRADYKNKGTLLKAIVHRIVFLSSSMPGTDSLVRQQ